MVGLVRAGRSQRSVAREFRVSLATVQLWVARAGDTPLEEVDWSDRPSARHRGPGIPAAVEDLILELRHELRDTSDLGEYGAVAIRRALAERGDGTWPVPPVRTIGRVLERRGALDGQRRVRRPAPPPGWYLPDLALRGCELDSFDVVDGLYLEGQPELGILTGISLHGGLPDAWPAFGMRVGQVVPAMLGRWRADGLPAYAQFDNDPRFIGGHAHPDSIGSVVRICLALGVVPVFAPPRESGFQASIESFNGRWQTKVWSRYRGNTLAGLQAQSDRWIAALRARSAVRIDEAPPRLPFPADVDPLGRSMPLDGRMIFLRRTNDAGSISVLGHQLHVNRLWPHRLVRAELDLAAGRIEFYGLRRREPLNHLILGRLTYPIPDRWRR